MCRRLVSVADDLSWLENSSNPALYDYLRHENDFSESIMRKTRKFRRSIEKEQRKWTRELESFQQTPKNTIRFGNYEYYSENPYTGFPIYYRRHVKTNKSEIILDANEFRSDYVHLQGFKISPDERLLAFSVDTTGKDSYKGQIIDLDTKRVLFQKANILGMEWALDSQTLFYAKVDTKQRASEVWKHRLSSFRPDTLVYAEKDEAYFVSVTRTKDSSFILINSNSKTTSEIWIVDALHPDRDPVRFSPRRSGVEWYLEHRAGRFYLLSNVEPNAEYCVVSADAKSVLSGEPFDLDRIIAYDERERVVVEDMQVFQSHCVLYERCENRPRVSLYHFDSGNLSAVDGLPFDVTTVEAGESEAHSETNSFSFHASSPTQPWTPFVIDTQSAKAATSTQWRQNQLTEINLEDFTLTRESVSSRDGTRIPLTIIAHKNSPRDRSSPCLAYVYGAYGKNLDVAFDVARLSLLKRGWVLAFCHARGGGELGRNWYHRGRGKAKTNTFHDLERCVERVNELGYSGPHSTGVYGSSAGGLAVAWLCNNRPDLVRAAVLNVPFVDVAGMMACDRLPLTSLELSEWADLAKAGSEDDFIRSYCPYLNLKRGAGYPAMLVTTALADERVPFWGPAKFVAKFRRLNECAKSWSEFHDSSSRSMVLLRSDFEGNHHVRGGDEEDQLDWLSFEYAFLYKALDLEIKR